MKQIRNSLGFDYRSMALYRVLIGLSVMADVIYRFEDLTNFYTDVGLLPRNIFLGELAMPWSFSLHLAGGSLGFAILMFSIHLLFGFMMTVGYKTRWAVLGAFIMTVSVHNRNWLVNNGGDDVLRAILFFSIFLPLNRWFSVDAALEKDRIKPTHEPLLNTWVMGFTMQLFVIYFVSYILKNHPIWRSDFTAIYYASRLDIFATPFGIWTRQYPILQTMATIFTVFLEWLGPLLLISAPLFGKRWWKVRLLVMILFWGLHIGIIMNMWIGVFPYLCIAMWSIILPGPVWDWFFDRFRRKHPGSLTLYFDGDCRFCEKVVHLLREFFLLPETKILAAQSVPEVHSRMLKNNSWVVMNEKGEKFFHYQAFVEVLKRSPLAGWTWRIANFSLFSKLGDALYRWVANHRQDMSKASQFLNFTHPKKEITWLKWVSQAAGAFMLVNLICWNLGTIKALNFRPGIFTHVTRWLHLYQEWNMFSPYPKLDNIWIEVKGELSDGTMVDVITGSRDIFSVRDKEFYQSVKNEHWRKFYLNLYNSSNNARYFGAYLCRRWNERDIKWVPNTTLRKMEIKSFSQLNLLNDGKGKIEEKLSWKHWCFDADYKRDNQGQNRPRSVPKL